MSKEAQVNKGSIVDYENTRMLPDSEPIDSIINKIIIISKVDFYPSKYGEIAHITTEEGKVYRTVSGVLVRDLKDRIVPTLEKGKKVRVKIERVKRYLRFTSP